MDHSLETDVAAGLALGGVVGSRGRHAMKVGTPCYNCGTPLAGPWCHACGQFGEDYHRSAVHLIGEAVEGLTHADSRLWRTLPRLILRPASLTRDYLAGKRASQVPPLRLFLVVLLLVFVSGELAASLGHVKFLNLGGDGKTTLFDSKMTGRVPIPADTDASDRASLKGLDDVKVHIYAPWDDALTAWTRTHIGRAVQHPDRFVEAIGAWAHDFAFLMLPISAFLLAGIFVFRRRFLLFDHLIFSMHSLSFQGLLFVLGMGLGTLGIHAWQLFFAAPVHLFVHMRGVYGTGRFGTVARMFVLMLGSLVALTLMILGLAVVGLAALRE